MARSSRLRRESVHAFMVVLLMVLLTAVNATVAPASFTWDTLFSVNVTSLTPSGYSVGGSVVGYTSETGGRAKVKVTPNFELTGGEVVTMSASSSDLTEGVVSYDDGAAQKAVLLIWTAAMLDPLSFYVIGQQDSVSDPDTHYNIVLEVVSVIAAEFEAPYTAQVASGDPLTYTYELVNYEDTAWSYDSRVLNNFGVNVTTLSTIATNTVTKAAMVTLDYAPTGIVVFAVTSNDGNEGLVAYPSVLVFTPSSYAIPQYIYVEGTNADEGEDEYTLQLDLIRSEDLYTTGMYPVTMVSIPVQSTFEALTDSYRVTIGVYGGDCVALSHVISEDSEACTLTLALCEYNLPWSGCTPIERTVLAEYFSEISAELNVTSGQFVIDDQSSVQISFIVDGDQSSTSTSEFVTYDLTVTPVNDVIKDGNITDYLNLKSALGNNVQTLEWEDLSGYFLSDFPYRFTVEDDDGAGVMFVTDDCTENDNGEIETGESGKACEAEIYLKSKPYGTITVTVSLPGANFGSSTASCGTGETAGIYDETVSPIYYSSVEYTFTTDDYDTPQSVTIKGCNYDDATNGDTPYTLNIAAANVDSQDSDYGLIDKDYAFTDVDDDNNALTVTTYPLNETPVVDETGVGFTFTVALGGGDPLADVYIPITLSSTTLMSSNGVSGVWLKYDATEEYIQDWSTECPDGAAGTMYLSCSGVCVSGNTLTLSANGACDSDMNCPLHNNDNSDCDADPTTDPVFNGNLYSFWDPSRDSTEISITGRHNDLYKSGGRSDVTVSLGPTVCTDGDAATTDDESFNDVTEDIVLYANNIDLLKSVSATSDIITTETGTAVAITVSMSASYVTFTSVSVAVTSSDTTEGTITLLSPADGYYECSADTETFRECAAQSITFTVQGIDDYIDDGDVGYTITVIPTVTYLDSDDQTQTMVTASATITATNTDDDTAGITISKLSGSTASTYTATNYKFNAYRGDSDVSASTSNHVTTMTFPDANTYESDNEQDVDFTIQLTSEPVGTVYVDVKTTYFDAPTCGDDASACGDSRHEAIAVSDTDTGLGLPYGLTRTAITIQDKVDGYQYMGYKDTTTADAYIRLAFTSSNWNTIQTVSIQGLDDLVDDSDYAYDVTLTTTATSDTTTYDNNIITIAFTNYDNDTYGVTSNAKSTKTAESYYDYTGDFNIYLMSEPVAAVLFVVSTSEPSQSTVSPSVLSFNADNWYAVQTVTVKGIDDDYVEDTLSYSVSASIVLSNDDAYSSIDVPNTIGYTLYDDPNDDAANSCSKGELGEIADDSCSYCPFGTYVEINGDKTNCRACPPGTMGVVQGGRAYFDWVYWDGTVMDPGCLPCPEGYYQPDFGQTNCLICPADKYCGPFGAFMAYDSELSESSATNMWSLIEQETFSVQGFKLEMDEQGFQSALLIIMLITTAFVSIVLLAMRLYVKSHEKWAPQWNKLKEMIKSKDTFAADHLDVYMKNGELVVAEEVGEHKELPGGLMAIGGLICATAFAIFMLFIYVNYNTLVTQILLPVDEELLRSSSTQLTWGVTFLGFAGCAVADGSTNSQVDVTLTGFTQNEVSMTRACDNSSNLIVDILMDHDSTVSTSPKLEVKAYSKCDECTADANDLYTCDNCTAAYARGFAYTITAQSLYDGDDNRVKATITPSASGSRSTGQMFRGGEVTTEVSLIQASYIDEIEDTKNYGFRIQYSQSDEGGAHTFGTNTSECYASYGCYFDEAAGEYDFGTMNLAKSSNLQKHFITDNAFTDADLDDSVTFTMSCAISTQQLYIQLSPLITWLDLYGAVGGTFESTAAVFLFILILYERVRNPEGRKRIMTALTTGNFRAMSPSTRARQGFGSPRKFKTGGGAGGMGGGRSRSPVGLTGGLRGRGKKRHSVNKKGKGGGGGEGAGGPDSPGSVDSGGGGDNSPPASPTSSAGGHYEKEAARAASPDGLESGDGGTNTAVSHLATSGIQIKVGSGHGKKAV